MIRENPEEFDRMLQLYMDGKIRIDDIMEKFHLSPLSLLRLAKNWGRTGEDKE